MFPIQNAPAQQQRFHKGAQRMAEDSGQRGLFASLMALLRPGGGVGQLLLLKAGEITAGQMQQVAREFDNPRTLASRDSWTRLSL